MSVGSKIASRLSRLLLGVACAMVFCFALMPTDAFAEGEGEGDAQASLTSSTIAVTQDGGEEEPAQDTQALSSSTVAEDEAADAKTPGQESPQVSTSSSAVKSAVSEQQEAPQAASSSSRTESAKAKAQTATKTSAEYSVDGNDYGWLFLAKDGCFYPLDYAPQTNNLICGYARDDQGVSRVYSSSELKSMKADPVSAMENYGAVYETLYHVGTLVYSYGPHLRLDLVTPPGVPGQGYSTTKASLKVFSLDPKKFASAHANSKLQCYRYAPWNVKRVIFEDTVAPYLRDHQPSKNTNGHEFVYLNNWFQRCYYLVSIEGFENISTDEVKSMAWMFSNCWALTELDLSSFDTSACEDFYAMFEECSSLDRLILGDGWTQAGADESLRATFPRPMICEETGKSYAAGDVIPDGAGTYSFATGEDRISIDQTTVLLGAPGKAATADPEGFWCEYTGGPLKPSVSLSYQGEVLQEGTDYEVKYADNTAEGEGKVIIAGRNAYGGTLSLPFAITDTSVYAFLLNNQTLYIKTRHTQPSLGTSSANVQTAYRWFDSQTKNPGATVPWAEQATRILNVVIDESFATVAPVTAERWFAGCKNLRSVHGLENINLSAATSVAGMFEGCSTLGEVELSALDLSNIADFSGMLRGCTNLETLDLGDADFSSATDTTGFYEGCANLKNLKMGDGWRNGESGLVFQDTAYRVSPNFAKYAAASAVPSGAAEYRISDIPMQSVSIVMPAKSYNCTGKPIKPKPTVKLGDIELVEGADYTLSYADNVYPGTASVTVKGKGIFSGGLVVNYKIKALISKVGNIVTYKDARATYTLKITKIAEKNGHAIAANAAITKVNVKSARTVQLLSPSTCTIGGVKVKVTAIGSKLGGNFRNVKAFGISSTVKTIGSRAFSKASKVKTLVVKSARLTSVTNCLKGSKITKVQVKASLSASKKKTYKTMFTKKAGKNITYRCG